MPLQPARVGIRFILVDSEAQAETLVAQIRAGAYFGSLAREHSLDPTSGNGGYLGVVSASEVRPEFGRAMAALDRGETSEVFQVGERFALLQTLTETEERWSTLNDSAVLAFSQGRTSDAERLLLEAIATAETSPRPDYMLSASLHSLAVLYTNLERYADAEPLYARSVGIVEEMMGPDHPELASRLGDQAANYELQEDYARAEQAYLGALRIIEETSGPDHVDAASILKILAEMYEVEGRQLEAEALYTRALAILERDLPAGHPELVDVADSLNRHPSFPEFTCDGQMIFCNRAVEAGLYAARRYGRGAAWVDIDGDGWDDLFLADSDNRWDPDNYGISMFFINQHDGTFRGVPATELGIADSDLVSTWNGSFADYDNDGDPDLLLANGGYSGVSNLAFYENRIASGGGFVSVTDASGIGAANAELSHWWGTSWADIDNDGRLDVIVTRTEGTALLFHSNGDGTFSDATSLLDVKVTMEDGKNPVWLDYDQDGDPDLYLAGLWEHAFYRNDAGRFTNITDQIFTSPFPYPADREEPRGPVVFAAAADDFNQDGLDDLYLGRWDVQDIVMLNAGDGSLAPHTTDWGLETSFAVTTDALAPYENTMGLGVGDLMDDGLPDVLIGTGDPSRAAPNVMFCNREGVSFDRCTDRIITGMDRLWRTRSHGTVFSDFDHDGDTDMAVNLGGHALFDALEGRKSPEWPALFVNVRGPSGNTATITLAGTTSNRDAVGARIRIAGQHDRHYVVRSMQAFQSQSSRDQVLSLGTSTRGDVEILWPSGARQRIEVSAGDRITVTEP